MVEPVEKGLWGRNNSLAKGSHVSLRTPGRGRKWQEIHSDFPTSEGGPGDRRWESENGKSERSQQDDPVVFLYAFYSLLIIFLLLIPTFFLILSQVY